MRKNVQEVAVEYAKDTLSDLDSLNKINEEYELIDCDPVDDPDNFKMQISILKELISNL